MRRVPWSSWTMHCRIPVLMITNARDAAASCVTTSAQSR
jgi:hypothetical protein